MRLLKNLGPTRYYLRYIHACGVPSELEYRYYRSMRLLKNLEELLDIAFPKVCHSSPVLLTIDGMHRMGFSRYTNILK